MVEAGDSLAEGRIAPNLNGLKSSVLCQGLHLYIGPKDSALVRVGVDLDER